MQKKIFLNHCFPVPYRNFLFELIYIEAQKRNLDLEVQFYASMDSSRPAWSFNSDQLKFKHKIWKPIYKRGPVFHLNLDLLWYTFRTKPDLIIMGGIWPFLNSIILAIFWNRPLIGWAETNRFTFGGTEKRGLSFKRFLLKRIKHLAVPGFESIEFYRDLLPPKEFRAKNFIELPNLIDETKFNVALYTDTELDNFRTSYNILKDEKIAYWPARFIPEKGIENFLSILDANMLVKWKVIIIGNGPLKKKVESILVEKKLDSHFILLDLLPYEEAIKFYFIANLLILPSLSDPNPLSLVEAIHSSLPILISNRVGNYNEVLEEAINGLSIDPYNPESMLKGAEKIFGKSVEELRSMGLESKRIAIKNFSSIEKIRAFFDSIEAIVSK